MVEIKKGVAHTIRYTPPKLKTGETVTIEIFNETGAEIVGSPFTATELVDPTGVYGQAFTPGAKGDWLVVSWYGTGSGKIAEIFRVVDNAIDDLATSTDLTAVKDKTDNLPADPASQGSVDSSISTAEGNIRGGTETLETLKDKIADTDEGGRII